MRGYGCPSVTTTERSAACRKEQSISGPPPVRAVPEIQEPSGDWARRHCGHGDHLSPVEAFAAGRFGRPDPSARRFVDSGRLPLRIFRSDLATWPRLGCAAGWSFIRVGVDVDEAERWTPSSTTLSTQVLVWSGDGPVRMTKDTVLCRSRMHLRRQRTPKPDRRSNLPSCIRGEDFAGMSFDYVTTRVTGSYQGGSLCEFVVSSAPVLLCCCPAHSR
jgi:hypothetical protein